MTIELIPVRDLTISQYQQYLRLNLGSKGLMRMYLKESFEIQEAKMKLRRNETILSISTHGRIQSWVLLLEFRNCSICKWKHGIHVYTRASARGKGYASNLIQEALALRSPNKIYCRGNTKFFLRYGIKYA